MESVPSTDLCHRTYVVTYGMAHRLQSFRSSTFRVPELGHPVFSNFQRALLGLVQDALPSIKVHAIHMDELERNIWEQAGNHINGSSNPIVLSTCSELAAASQLTRKVEGYTLHFNRLFNTDGEIIGYGPRHGFDSLSKQFAELGRKIGKHPIILVEDGAFSGKTLCYILDRLKDHGVHVAKVVIGFCCARAQVLVKQTFTGELVIVNPIEDLVDWIPDHDLIPFTPNCGRVLGQQSEDGFCCMETSDGLTHSFPYILPFGKMGEWSSLPSECLHNLSTFCLDASIEIFSEFGEYIGHKVTIRDLMKCHPRFSIPVAIGNHGVVLPLDTQIVPFLKQTREGLRK